MLCILYVIPQVNIFILVIQNRNCFTTGGKSQFVTLASEQRLAILIISIPIFYHLPLVSPFRSSDWFEMLHGYN